MNQHKKLEQRYRYIIRPAIANERLKLNSTGDVVLRLKSPYRRHLYRNVAAVDAAIDPLTACFLFSSITLNRHSSRKLD